MTVAAYVRVSSRSQDVATQRDAIGRCARARGDVVATWFVETRSATRALDRPALNELRAAVRAGDFRTVYVFRLDRFARSGIRDTLTVLDELRGAGCKVVTVSDGFDLEGPFRDVIAAVMAWVAQMEGLARGERVAAARVRVEAAGKHWGRPRRANPETVDRARQMQGRGRTVRQIAVALKIPRSTVQTMLAGKGPYNDIPLGVGKPGQKKPKKSTSGPV